jgi:hypothetical protein
MRRVLAVFCVLTIVALAVGIAQADPEMIFYNNWDNGGGNYVPGTEFFNPNATTDGAVWKKIGAADPIFNPDDFTLECFVKMADNNFVSMGTESVSVAGYPGYFIGSVSHATPSSGLWGTYGDRRFVLKAWIGSYPGYEAAYAAGAYCGITPEFYNPAVVMPSLPPSLTKMPALILSQPVPEPSTIVLTAAAAVGALAYRWRKRK